MEGRKYSQRRRILYITGMAPQTTTVYRLEALLRLNHEVQVFDIEPYFPHHPLLRKAFGRFPLDAVVRRINHDLQDAARRFKPDVAWFDKPTLFTKNTMSALREMGAQIVFYVQDGPFGPRNDKIWRQFYQVYRLANLHCLFREADVVRYKAWGLPLVKTMFSFDAQSQFPPPKTWSEADRNRDISYIGHPHEQRPDFLIRLAEEFHLPVFINGNQWERKLTEEQIACVQLGPQLLGAAYREAIWRSRVNLSFVTEMNEDDIAHKSVEIAACGGFLLALRTQGHQAAFEEDKEAVFFSSIEECAEKARYYLGRPDLREAIGRRAYARAIKSGYDNDTQMARILSCLDGSENG